MACKGCVSNEGVSAVDVQPRVLPSAPVARAVGARDHHRPWERAYRRLRKGAFVGLLLSRSPTFTG